MHDEEIKSLIEQCLLPVAKRPTARQLLSHPFIDPTGPLTDTTLLVAATNGNTELLEELIRKGFDVNVQDEDDGRGRTPVSLALEHGHHTCVTALITAGCHVNSCDWYPGGPYYTLTPLQYAFYTTPRRRHCCDSVKALIDAGADVKIFASWSNWSDELPFEEEEEEEEAQDSSEEFRKHFPMSPLYLAIQSVCLGCVMLIIQAGADVNEIYHYDLFGSGDTDPVESLLHLVAGPRITDVHILNALITAGAQVMDVYDWTGSTVLHSACEGGSVECFNALLTAPNAQFNLPATAADATMINHNGWSLLHKAASNAHVPLIHLLLSMGCDMLLDLTYASTTNGRRGLPTPLACVKNYAKLGEAGVRMLVSEHSQFTEINHEHDPPRSVYCLLQDLVPPHASTSPLVMKKYFLRSLRRDKFLLFGLGAHERSGRESPVKLLISDVMQLIFAAMLED